MRSRTPTLSALDGRPATIGRVPAIASQPEFDAADSPGRSLKYFRISCHRFTPRVRNARAEPINSQPRSERRRPRTAAGVTFRSAKGRSFARGRAAVHVGLMQAGHQTFFRGAKDDNQFAPPILASTSCRPDTPVEPLATASRPRHDHLARWPAPPGFGAVRCP